jgi:hypothetical protein
MMKLETFTYMSGEGWSNDPLPELDSEQTLVIVFGASNYLDDPGPIQQLVAAYPKAKIMGCSTAGEIFGTSLHDGSLSIAVIQFEHTRVALASTKVTSMEDSHAGGEFLAEHLAGPELKAVFVLSNGTDINGSELVRGLNEKLPEGVTVTGGLAGDGDRFERTWVIHEGLLGMDYICAVGFYGERIRVGHGSKGGWDVFGPQRQVTQAAGNVLYELDGKPALDLYKEYLGELASDLPSSALLFPLALSTEPDDEKSIVRTILSIDERTNSLTFAGDIPNGSYTQLMKANFDRLINGASDAALMIRETAKGSNKGKGDMLCIAISCVGRRLVLGERTEEELEAALEVLPAGVQQIGFYSYGEISPYVSGTCDLHNQTMTLTTIQEV